MLFPNTTVLPPSLIYSFGVKCVIKLVERLRLSSVRTKLLETLLPFRTFPSLSLNPKTDFIDSYVIMSTVFLVIVGPRISLKVLIAMLYFG